MPDLILDHTEPLPSNVPDRVEDANKLFTDMFWAADAIGILSRDAEEIVNRVLKNWYKRDDGKLAAADLPILHRVVKRVGDELQAAMDEDGRPRGENARMLIDSERFEAAPASRGGVLETSSGRSVRTIETRLYDVQLLLEYAMAHDLVVKFP